MSKNSTKVTDSRGCTFQKSGYVQSLRSRFFCFTKQLQDCSLTALEMIKNCDNDHPPFSWAHHKDFRYMIYQLERAPTTGQLHYQGYIQFKQQISLTGCNKLDGHTHFEVCKGSPSANKDYCTKKETRVYGPWEIGNFCTGKGQRNDISSCFEMVKAGKSTLEILEATNGKAARFTNALKLMKFCCAEKDSDRQLTGIHVTAVYGETGWGKSYHAMNQLSSKGDYYVLEPPNQVGGKVWFDGYEGQRTLIIEDFAGAAHISYRMLLRILDVYKLKVEIKGGFTWAVWTNVVITSNAPPSLYYTVDSSEHLGPLKRRIHEIRHFVSRTTYVLENFEGEQLSTEHSTLVSAPVQQFKDPSSTELGSALDEFAYVDPICYTVCSPVISSTTASSPVATTSTSPVAKDKERDPIDDPDDDCIIVAPPAKKQKVCNTLVVDMKHSSQIAKF